MTTELWMLIYSALLAMLVPTIYLSGRAQVPEGFRWALGNRDTTLDGAAPWVGRAIRAHTNLVENLPVFAILVLTANAIGLSNDTTALGAALFFYGRLAHVITYLVGLVPWRTLAFFVATAGELMILFEIFSAA